jgi:hypothetical protein
MVYRGFHELVFGALYFGATASLRHADFLWGWYNSVLYG